ncbi:hypothetical protein [Pseudaminobacter soli (ex Li et al. 2025)]|nr:hypothetical protein [Mesorhizobium soli]
MMAFVPKVVDGERREFVVVPPADVQFDEMKDRIAEALREQFPQSGFTIITDVQSLRGYGFTLVPVIMEPADGPATKPPSESVLAEIMAFLDVHFASIPAPKLN